MAFYLYSKEEKKTSLVLHNTFLCEMILFFYNSCFFFQLCFSQQQHIIMFTMTKVIAEVQV